MSTITTSAHDTTFSANGVIELTPTGQGVGDLAVVCIMAAQNIGLGNLASYPDGWDVECAFQGDGVFNSVIIAKKIMNAANIGETFTFTFSGRLDLSGAVVCLNDSTNAWYLYSIGTNAGANALYGNLPLVTLPGVNIATLCFNGMQNQVPSGAITDVNGNTYTEVFSQGLSTDPNCLVQAGAFANLAQNGAFPPFWANPGGPAAGNCTIWFTEALGTPLIPNDVNPVAGVCIDASTPIPFSAFYHPTNGEAMNAYALRVKRGTAGYYYWNENLVQWQAAAYWNLLSDTAFGEFVVSPPAGLTNGPINPTGTGSNVWSYSMATREAGANTYGPFAPDITFTTASSPVVTVTSPSATQDTSEPTVTWSLSLAPGATQAGFQVRIYNTTTGNRVYDSGFVPGTSQSFQITKALKSGNYQAQVLVADSNNLNGSAYGTTWALVIEVPVTPTFSVTASNDPITSAPQGNLFFQGMDNLISNDDAAMNLGLGSWTAGAFATVTWSPTHVFIGAKCLKITPTTPGDECSAITTYYPLSGTDLSITAQLWPGSYAGPYTFKAIYYDDTNTEVGSSTSVTSSLTPAAWNLVTAGAPSDIPATATQFRLQVLWTASGTEQLWVDEVGAYLQPSAPGWSAGGFVGSSVVEIQSSLDNENFVDIAGYGNASLPSPGETLTFVDRTPAPGTPTYYQARITGTIGSTPYNSEWVTAGPIITDALGLWWLQIPGDPLTAVGFALSTDAQLKPKEIATVNYPLGDPTPTKKTDGFKLYGGIIPIRIVSITNLNRMANLIQYEGTMLLSNPSGFTQYVQHDPQTDPIQASVFNTLGLGDNAYTNITFNIIGSTGTGMSYWNVSDRWAGGLKAKPYIPYNYVDLYENRYATQPMNSQPLLVTSGSVSWDTTALIRRTASQVTFIPTRELPLVPNNVGDLTFPDGTEMVVNAGLQYPNGDTETVPQGRLLVDDTITLDASDGDNYNLTVAIDGSDRMELIARNEFTTAWASRPSSLLTNLLPPDNSALPGNILYIETQHSITAIAPFVIAVGGGPPGSVDEQMLVTYIAPGSGTMTVTAANRGYNGTVSTYHTPGFGGTLVKTTLDTVIGHLVQRQLPGVPMSLSPASQNFYPAFSAASVGGDPSSFLADQALTGGMEVFFDQTGTLVLAPIGDPSAVPTSAQYVEGPGTIMTQVQRTLSNQGVANHVIVTSQGSGIKTPLRADWFDTNPNSPTYFYGDYPETIYSTTTTIATTQAQVQAIANAIGQAMIGNFDAMLLTTLGDPAFGDGCTATVTRYPSRLSAAKYVFQQSQLYLDTSNAATLTGIRALNADYTP